METFGTEGATWAGSRNSAPAGVAADDTLYYNFTAGTRVGPHTLLRQIGVGGMGEVYEAWHEGTEELCALKILARRLADDAHAIESFRREAELMRALRHPNVVAVEDAGEDGPCHWLRMELMRSVRYRGSEVKSLDDYLKAHGAGLDQGTGYAILENIVSATAAAHARRLVHRDLKPANILMTHCGDLGADRGTAVMDVRVADFGMVKVVGEEWVRRQSTASLSRGVTLGDRETQAQGDRRRALIGTYAYMSPEQKRGLPTDARTDVYSLGLLTFRALVGCDPCPVRPSRLRHDLSPAWDGLLMRALEPEPANRFADCTAFRQAMAELETELAANGFIDEQKG